MSDLMKREEFPSTKSLTKNGVAAIGYIAAGTFIGILNAFSNIPVLGFIASGAVLLIGIGSFFSKDPADKKAGLIITAAGALTLLSKIPFLTGISQALLGVGIFGLLAVGVFNAIKFFRGLKKRS